MSWRNCGHLDPILPPKNVRSKLCYLIWGQSSLGTDWIAVVVMGGKEWNGMVADFCVQNNGGMSINHNHRQARLWGFQSRSVRPTFVLLACFQYLSICYSETWPKRECMPPRVKLMLGFRVWCSGFPILSMGPTFVLLARNTYPSAAPRLALKSRCLRMVALCGCQQR